MESVVISGKRLQMAMWSCFTNGRELPHGFGDYQVHFVYDDHRFRFLILDGDRELVSHSINRHTAEMETYSVFSYAGYLHKAWMEFLSKAEALKNNQSAPLSTIPEELKVWEDKIGEGWGTWLNPRFEDEVYDKKSMKEISPVRASNMDLSECRSQFVKNLDKAVREGKVKIFKN